jgi:para-nitrobenzyl esterase
MIRTALAAGVLASSVLAVTAFAAEPAPAAPVAAAPKYSTADTPIGTLLDDPAAKAVVDKNMPGFSDNPQVAMARSMTFKQIQSFAPDQIKEETLIKLDADLAKLK